MSDLADFDENVDPSTLPSCVFGMEEDNLQDYFDCFYLILTDTLSIDDSDFLEVFSCIIDCAVEYKANMLFFALWVLLLIWFTTF